MLATPNRPVLLAVVVGCFLWAQASLAASGLWPVDRAVAEQLHVDVNDLTNRLGIDRASEAEWWAKFLRTCEEFREEAGKCRLMAGTLAEQKESADSDNPLLQNTYALRLTQAVNDGKPTHESLIYFLKAAEAGEPHAQVTLGWYCMHGIGLPRNLAAAYRWNHLGAVQGHPEGANNLGFQYQYGLGVKQNLEKARDWYRYAAIRGSLIGLASLLQMGKDNDSEAVDKPSESDQLSGTHEPCHRHLHTVAAGRSPEAHQARRPDWPVPVGRVSL